MATFKTNQQRERNKKKKKLPLHHLQNNVKQIYDVSSEKNSSGSKNLISDEELDDEEMLKNFGAILSSPACKSDVLNKWFICVYQIKNK